MKKAGTIRTAGVPVFKSKRWLQPLRAAAFRLPAAAVSGPFNEEIARLQELGVQATEEDLALMAHKCAVGVGGAMGSARLLNEEDMLAIFRASC